MPTGSAAITRAKTTRNRPARRSLVLHLPENLRSMMRKPQPQMRWAALARCMRYSLCICPADAAPPSRRRRHANAQKASYGSKDRLIEKKVTKVGEMIQTLTGTDWSVAPRTRGLKKGAVSPLKAAIGADGSSPRCGPAADGICRGPNCLQEISYIFAHAVFWCSWR